MSISVRRAEIRDLEFVSQDDYTTRDVIQRKIEWNEVFVAQRDDISVGYLRLEYLWSSEPYIGLIRVLQPHRRRGVGRALLASVEDTLRSEGHTVLYSSSQADENEPQAWHRHVGFVECGILNGVNDGIGEIFFRKSLTQ